MSGWDVIVVGAGPAGATAALAVLRQTPTARVLILDAASFPRDKVCGDGVAPHALDVLADLGVDTDDIVAGSKPVMRLTLRAPSGVEASRPFERMAFVVPRLLFDQRILDAALAAGARFERRRVRTIEARRSDVIVDGDLRARTVIGADGAESVVRRQIGARAAPDGTVAIAVRGYAPATPWPAAEQLISMTRSNWPAYAWMFPIGDGRANVGYGELLRGTPPSRAHLVERLHALLPDLAEVAVRGHRLPLSTGRPRVGHGRVLLTGDAASLINPLTGEGIFYAVLSGSLAGTAALAGDPSNTYRVAMRRALGRHLRTTDAMVRLTRRPALIDRGVEAARSSQHAFDRLVDIGLGSGTIDARTAVAIARRLPGAISRRS